MFHIPQTYDFDEATRRRKEQSIKDTLKKIKEGVNAPQKTGSEIVNSETEKASKYTRIAKKVIDLLPEPSAEQKKARKKNREDMKNRLFFLCKDHLQTRVN